MHQGTRYRAWRSVRRPGPKAAKAIIAAVGSDEPPALLLLGSDALRTYRRLAETRLDTIKKWERVTSSTDIDA
jgi:hypothetical protein